MHNALDDTSLLVQDRESDLMCYTYKNKQRTLFSSVPHSIKDDPQTVHRSSH